MDYQRIYNSLMFHAVARGNVDGYKEIHHIVPKSMGGTDLQANLVALTAREHFIAHVLLAKLYGGNMWFAVLAMSGKANRKEIYAKGRMYEVAKKENAKVRSVAMAGTKVSIESKEKIRYALVGNKNALGKRTLETKINISKSLIGRKLSQDHAAKLKLASIGNKSNTGKKASEETRRKMSLAHIGQQKTIGMTGKKHSEATRAKMSFTWQCKKNNKLIDSVFTNNQNYLEVNHA